MSLSFSQERFLPPQISSVGGLYTAQRKYITPKKKDGWQRMVGKKKGWGREGNVKEKERMNKEKEIEIHKTRVLTPQERQNKKKEEEERRSSWETG